MADEFIIRPLSTHQDFLATQEIQRQAWKCGDLEVLPLHILHPVARYGGVVLGAFSGDEMVGFVFGFLGASEKYGPEAPAAVRLKHCSHMLAVLPQWQNRNVGYALKLAQREAARAQALRLITWTYDPLESRNAHFNLARLGAVCDTFIRDLYGPMEDGLNQGLPTDRFQVDWYIASKRIEIRLSRGYHRQSIDQFMSAGAHLINPPRTVEASPLLYPCEQPTPPASSLALVEIPADFQAIKRASQQLALEWRLHTRLIFETAFRTGYSAIDFIHEAGRSLYVLVQTGDVTPQWSIFADDIVDPRKD